MAGLLSSNLDAYSRFAISLILARFPEWEPFAVVGSRPDSVEGTVEFNIPCPSPAVEMGLWVSTDDEELSVGFHTHHGHFTDYDPRCNPEQIEAGLDQAATRPSIWYTCLERRRRIPDHAGNDHLES